jgi:hypothetical protein
MGYVTFLTNSSIEKARQDPAEPARQRRSIQREPEQPVESALAMWQQAFEQFNAAKRISHDLCRATRNHRTHIFFHDTVQRDLDDARGRHSDSLSDRRSSTNRSPTASIRPIS